MVLAKTSGIDYQRIIASSETIQELVAKVSRMENSVREETKNEVRALVGTGVQDLLKNLPSQAEKVEQLEKAVNQIKVIIKLPIKSSRIEKLKIKASFY